MARCLQRTRGTATRSELGQGETISLIFLGILHTTVLSETLEPTGDRNDGGGGQEGGANSQGILAPPPILLVSRSRYVSISSASVPGPSGQSGCAERMRDVWTNSFPHLGKHPERGYTKMTLFQRVLPEIIQSGFRPS